MNSDNQDKYQIKKKRIILRKSSNQAVFYSLLIPNQIYFPDHKVYLLTQLKNRLKLLYINVLCRGFHKIQGLEQMNKYIFTEEISKTQRSFSQQEWIVSNLEAVPTIWKSLAREIGRPCKSYPIQESRKQIQKQIRALEDKALNKKIIQNKATIGNDIKLKQYQLKCSQIRSTRQRISQQLGKIKKKYDLEVLRQRKQKQIIAKVMKQQIILLQKTIFINSIISIKNGEGGNVEIFLEQSYPKIIMPHRRASFLLGESIFTKKLNQYKRNICRYPIIHNSFSQIYVCHRCMKTLNQYPLVGICDNRNATLQVNSQLLADPYTFCRIIMNENYQEEDDKKYIHPYLKYYSLKDNLKKAVCNRYYCNKCEAMQISLHLRGSCNYCAGVCDCRRCKSMDELIMMMAIYIDNGGYLQGLTKQFLFNFVGNNIEAKSQEIKFVGYETKYMGAQVIDFFKDQRVFKKKKTLTVNYEEESYISNKIQQQQSRIKQYKKYKMKVVAIGESDLDKKERRQRQQRERKKLQALNKIINGGKNPEKIQLIEDSSTRKRKSKSLQKIHQQFEQIHEELLKQDSKKDDIGIFYDQ